MSASRVDFMVGAVLLLFRSAAGAPELCLRYAFDEPGIQADTGTPPAAPASLTGATITTDSPGGYSRGSLDLTANAVGNCFATASGSVPKVNQPSEMTVTFWMNLREQPMAGDCLASDVARHLAPEGKGGWRVSIGSSGGPPTASRFQILLGLVQGHGFFENVWTCGSDPVDADHKWVFVGISYAPLQTRFHIGTETAPVAFSGPTWITSGAIYGNTEPLRIGGDTGFPAEDRTPPAWIDDFRFYRQALTLQELEAVRQSNLPEPTMLILAGSGSLLIGVPRSRRRQAR